MERLFFALQPDEIIQSELNHIIQQLDDRELKVIKQTNLHMTLEFVGEISEKEQHALTTAVDKLQAKQFNLRLTHMGWWQKPAILWLAPDETPPLLNALVNSLKACINQLGLKVDDRPYRPHVTLARKVKQAKAVSHQKFDIEWPVSRFVLMRSESTPTGVEYRVLREWPLLAS
jgi:2'-5' RNA ligase